MLRLEVDGLFTPLSWAKRGLRTEILGARGEARGLKGGRTAFYLRMCFFLSVRGRLWAWKPAFWHLGYVQLI